MFIYIFSDSLEQCLRIISPLAHLGSPSLHTLTLANQRKDVTNLETDTQRAAVEEDPRSPRERSCACAVPVGSGRFGCGRALYLYPAPCSHLPSAHKNTEGFGQGVSSAFRGGPDPRSGGCRKTKQNQSQQKIKTGDSGWCVQQSSSKNGCRE